MSPIVALEREMIVAGSASVVPVSLLKHPGGSLDKCQWTVGWKGKMVDVVIGAQRRKAAVSSAEARACFP